jgi:hypothetical protein
MLEMETRISEVKQKTYKNFCLFYFFKIFFLICQAREKAMQNQLIEVLSVQNETVAALKRAKSDLNRANGVIEAMRLHVLMMEEEREQERIEKV